MSSADSISGLGRLDERGRPADGDLPKVDGRVARSERTRQAIIDAMRALNQQGVLRPTARQISERAGVSLRTVWQHFGDLESLLAEAGKRDLEIALSYSRRIDLGAPLAERITELVEQRAQLYEDITPVWRAGRLQEPFSPQVAACRDLLIAQSRRQLERLFAPELARRGRRGTDGAVEGGEPAADGAGDRSGGDWGGGEERAALLSSLELATSWAAWDALRAGQQLSCDEARATVITMLTALLDPPDREDR